MLEKKQDRTQSVKLQRKTLDRLEGFKHPGQSWDGVINELLDIVRRDGKGK